MAQRPYIALFRDPMNFAVGEAVDREFRYWAEDDNHAAEIAMKNLRPGEQLQAIYEGEQAR